MSRTVEGRQWYAPRQIKSCKEVSLSPEEAAELAEKAEKMNMSESEYLRFMILQKPTDYPEMRILLRKLINEVNHIGTNVNQIVYNNSGLYAETDKEQLVAYMRKLNVEVNKVYEVISKRKS